jgi:predicted ATPase
MTLPPMTEKRKTAAADDDEDDVPLRFSIFPRSSTTLITCASNSGKTWFLRQVMLHRRVFIEAGEKIRRVVYVNCNQRDAHFNHPWEAEEEEDEEEEEEE